jgi:hypothetical protein
MNKVAEQIQARLCKVAKFFISRTNRDFKKLKEVYDGKKINDSDFNEINLYRLINNNIIKIDSNGYVEFTPNGKLVFEQTLGENIEKEPQRKHREKRQKERWESYLLEQEMPHEVYDYVITYLKKPWPEAEPILMEKSEYAYEYAKNILKKRWPEAEPIIIKERIYAWPYARDVIKGRWPEAEKEIKKDREDWGEYKEYFNVE